MRYGDTKTLSMHVNAFHPRGRRVQTTGQKCIKMFVKSFKIVEFHDHIWNHREKYIQKSTNMPGIGSLIREIDFKN